MEHVYDFYKADLTSEYPIVDGHYSIQCYTRALDKCYQTYNAKLTKQLNTANFGLTNGHTNRHTNGHNGHKEEEQETSIDRFAHIAFHAPTAKLVQKSYARLLYNDYLLNPSSPQFSTLDTSIQCLSYSQSLTDKPLEKTFMQLTKKRFDAKIYNGTLAGRLCGNMYTASVFASLASILSVNSAEELLGQRIGVFSYGSGLASSFYSLRVVGDVTEIARSLKLQQQLDERHKVAPAVYDEVRPPRKDGV
jgi:hydroxymethylglutaryl-CoA synthase